MSPCVLLPPDRCLSRGVWVAALARYLLAAVIGGSASSPLGLPHELSSSILNLGQQLSGRKLVGPKGEVRYPPVLYIVPVRVGK